ncbi:MAG: N-methyl-L-tryptophan oxidase [Chloroflexi bacterium]|nr:N-methyl-L-tryptophan oxidase [Chloroflexota bacterium]
MTTDGREWDVIVVGLGALGSAAAYWAACRPGTRVLGLERFELGHANGASADHSRIIRLSYHRPDYVRLAKRAFETWAVVEAEAREKIVTVTGGLDLWPADPGIPMDDYTESLVTEAVPFELLDAAEVMRRWPQWHLPDDVTGMWQSRGGLADPYRGNAAHRRLASARGATLLGTTPVTAIRQVGGAYEVDAGDTRHVAGRVILTADAWTNELLASFDRRLPLTVTKEQVTYFAARDPATFAPDRFPVWIWMDEPSYYGIPTYGKAGPKVAQDAGGQPTTVDTRTFERDDAMYDRVRRFAETYLPDAVGPELLTKTCLYTLTPDRDFVVDRVPDAPGVIVGLGAGHGFKFASVLGRIAVELALDGASPCDAELGAFRIDRPILLEEDPPTNWMV